MYTNILIPVSFDASRDNASAFRVARTLASDGATITLLHVMEPVPGYVASQIPADILAGSQGEAEQRLKDLAEAVPGAKTEMMSGHAGRSIASFASSKGVDCLILASHKHGLGDYFIGSTADWVVRHVNCCVHVIR
ncbi:MAG: universal stress protein [Rhodobacteraceae bacterium]|nr:universal stress protein [Paracoccaceae bacterium]